MTSVYGVNIMAVLSKPIVVKMTQAEVDALLSRIKDNALTEADRELLVDVVQSHSWIYRTLEFSKITISKFKGMLFGGKTEKRKRKDKKWSDDTAAKAANDAQSPVNDTDSDKTPPSNS